MDNWPPSLFGCAFPLASYPGLLTPAFVACSTNTGTAGNKRWGEKAWVRGYLPSVDCCLLFTKHATLTFGVVGTVPDIHSLRSSTLLLIIEL